jgi:hypothetical protein
VPGAAEQPPSSNKAESKAGSHGDGRKARRLSCSRTGVDHPRSAATVRKERSIRTGTQRKAAPMRGILLWLIGIPIPIIILLYLFNVL